MARTHLVANGILPCKRLSASSKMLCKINLYRSPSEFCYFVFLSHLRLNPPVRVNPLITYACISNDQKFLLVSHENVVLLFFYCQGLVENVEIIPKIAKLSDLATKCPNTNLCDSARWTQIFHQNKSPKSSYAYKVRVTCECRRIFGKCFVFHNCPEVWKIAF